MVNVLENVLTHELDDAYRFELWRDLIKCHEAMVSFMHSIYVTFVIVIRQVKARLYYSLR